MTEIRIPDDAWDTDDTPEGAVSNWLYDDGETVEQGAAVVTVMAGKTEYDIPAPASGTLHIDKAADAPVAPGTVLGRVE